MVLESWMFKVLRDMWASRQAPTWTLEEQAHLERALTFMAYVCASLVVSHIGTTVYIAYHDITGKWDQYSLKYQRNTFWTYARHASSFFFDVVFLLAPALVAFGYYYDERVWEPLLKYGGDPWRDGPRVAILLFSSLLNNIINRLWAMAVHYVMHENKYLYQHIHRRHHCAIRDMCALSAWQDTCVEFILMEVFGVFLFAQLFNPLPWHFHVLLAAYNGLGGAIDHSAFYIPGTWIDGRYHWDHHLLINYNYSEIEFLDSIFGTLYIRDNSQTVIAEPPRLRHKHARDEPARIMAKEILLSEEKDVATAKQLLHDDRKAPAA